MTLAEAKTARRHALATLGHQDEADANDWPVCGSWRMQAMALLEQANAVIRAHEGQQPELREVA